MLELKDEVFEPVEAPAANFDPVAQLGAQLPEMG